MTGRKAAVILGANRLNRAILDKFKAQGLHTVVVDFRPVPQLIGDLNLCVDVKDTDRVLAALREKGIAEVEICYTSMDVAVQTASRVHENYGLRPAPPDALERTLEKDLMKKAWKESGVFNRYSETFSTLDSNSLADIIAINAKYKTVIKPNRSADSRGVSIIEKGTQESELRSSFEKASRFSADAKVLVEECVDEQEYTVEMLGDDYGNVSVYGVSMKYPSKYAGNNNVTVKQLYNSIELDADKYQRIAEAGIRAYKSLGLKNSFGHLEIFEREGGMRFSPVEIGARSSCYIASPILDVTTGKDYLGDYVKTLRGGKIFNGVLEVNDQAAMYYFYDIPEGSTSVRTTHLMKHIDPRIKSHSSDREKIVAGNKFERITCGNDRHGVEILVGPRDVLTVEEVTRAEARFVEEFLGAS